MPAAVDDRDVVLRLVQCGRLSGSLLVDPGIPVDTVRLEAGKGSFLVIPLADGTFEIPNLKPGRVEVRVVTRRYALRSYGRSSPKTAALATIPGIRVEAGQTASLRAIDLRGLLTRFDALVTDTKGTALALTWFKATTPVVRPLVGHYTSHEGKVTFIAPARSLSVVASKRGFRDKTVEVKPGQNRITLELARGQK